MRVTKCDACGRAIKRGESKLGISGEPLKSWDVDICETCAKPFFGLLKKLDLLKTENRA